MPGEFNFLIAFACLLPLVIVINWLAVNRGKSKWMVAAVLLCELLACVLFGMLAGQSDFKIIPVSLGVSAAFGLPAFLFSIYLMMRSVENTAIASIKKEAIKIERITGAQSWGIKDLQSLNTLAVKGYGFVGRLKNGSNYSFYIYSETPRLQLKNTKDIQNYAQHYFVFNWRSALINKKFYLEQDIVDSKNKIIFSSDFLRESEIAKEFSDRFSSFNGEVKMNQDGNLQVVFRKFSDDKKMDQKLLMAIEILNYFSEVFAAFGGRAPVA